jgi:FKBP-type peptidyl-prolyl cis-trans isomerase
VRHFSWIAACALVLSAAACSTDTTSVSGGPPALVGDTVTLASGLRYIDATVGAGATAHAGQSAAVHYSGWLTNGTLFDTSLNGSPYVFTIGAGSVIQGWDQGIPGMRVGGKRRLIVPPSLGYGAAGSGSIPPNSTLIFDVELRALSGS